MKKSVLIIIALVLWGSINAQDKEVMGQYQNRLQKLFDKVQNAPTDNERYLANEQAVQLFQEAFQEEDSHNWKWSFTNYVSVLQSPDKQFKIITWPVVKDNGEYECFGFIQCHRELDEDAEEEEDEWPVFVLHDMSDEIINREESILEPNQWLGSVYQEIIQTSFEGKNYYTLLGWNGCSMLTQRRVIEPICFHPRDGRPQFGQALFRKDKNRRRIVLEYNKEAMVNLNYEQQMSAEDVRVKKDGKMVTETQVQKEQMIIFDELEPQVTGMEGLYQYYVPSGREMAYVFVNGKWELRENAQGRLTDKKLNKDFKPIEKKTPAYQTIDKEE